MVACYNSPPRRGRTAKTKANRSLSEESDEDSVEMVNMEEEEEEFSETLLLDPTSPPRKLSLKSKVILRKVDVTRASSIYKQVAKANSLSDEEVKGLLQLGKVAKGLEVTKVNIEKTREVPTKPVDNDQDSVITLE